MDYSEINSHVRPLDLVKDGNILYAAVANSNYIYELYELDKRVRALGKFDDNFYSYPYIAVEKYENDLFFIPKRADKIAVFNLDSRIMTYIDLKNPIVGQKMVYRETLKFCYTITHGELLFALGYFYPAIACLNMRTKEIKYITEWRDEFEGHITQGNDCGYFGGGYYEEDNKLYIPCAGIPYLLELDLSNFETKLQRIDCGLDGILDLQKDNEKLWLIGKKESYGYVSRYDLKTKENIVIKPCDKLPVKTHYLPFWNIICDSQKVYLIPRIAKEGYVLDKETLEIHNIDIKIAQDCYDEFGEISNFYMVKQIENKVYTVSFEGIWYELDLINGEISKYEYIIPNEICKDELKNRINKQGICNEAQVGLETFIDFITDGGNV